MIANARKSVYKKIKFNQQNMKKIVFAVLLMLLITGCTTQEAPKETEKETSSETEVTAWTLDEDSSPDAPIYKGKSELKGWIVQAPKYIDDMYPHFRVADDYLKTLPSSIQDKQNYLLKEWEEVGSTKPKFVDVSQDIITELETYSESNPATITVDRIIISQEGSPSLGFVEIVK
ncbi:hypothetical protein A3I58_01240 [Candidatus Peregrinibacteria bacterium RIFCSPLOWO2_02_FULL_39_10]|nr:MAG: hypothetical protein A3I58_01240 [Candidatus Peregrinibacteria bacterium RIFCSPLOWO2_02_FULL_39_10]